VVWKYFQWLTLLFAEIYLDRYFKDPEGLLDDLNGYVERFNRHFFVELHSGVHEGDDRRRSFQTANHHGETPGHNSATNRRKASGIMHPLRSSIRKTLTHQPSPPSLASPSQKAAELLYTSPW